jgi:hypothetical protein
MRLWRLKDYLGPELIDARSSRAQDSPEVRVRHVTNGDAPLCVVECIERLEAELEANSLRYGEVLEQSRVPID